MDKKRFAVLGIAVALVSILVLAGCSGGAAATQNGPVAPTVVTATVNGDTVSIPANVINTKRNVEFDVQFDKGTASYMAYSWSGAIQVRASVCVPCRGRSFTLNGNNLVCNNCGTIFSAQTGKGVSGVPACQNYPKADVPFKTSADGSITMSKADLLTAFENTLTPGLP